MPSPADLFLVPGRYYELNAGAAVAMTMARAATAVRPIQISFLRCRRLIL